MQSKSIENIFEHEDVMQVAMVSSFAWNQLELKRFQLGLTYTNFRPAHLKTRLKVLNRLRERKRYIMSPMKNRKRAFYGFNIKFSMYIEYTRKKSEIPPWGKGKKEGESFPIAFIKPIFRPFLSLGLVAEVAERRTHNQKVPGSNPVGNHYFFPIQILQIFYIYF